MELKEYVKNSLLEIAEGVREAISESEGKGYFINPAGSSSDNKKTIKFSVSVEATKKGEINVKVFDGGIDRHTSNTLEFEVPILLPVSKTESFKMAEEKNNKKPNRTNPLSENH